MCYLNFIFNNSANYYYILLYIMTTKKKPISYLIYFTGNNISYKDILVSDGLTYLPIEDQHIYNKLTENTGLCFAANWNSHFNITNPENRDNIILYFDGLYGDEHIVSSAATIYFKDITYIDEFDEPPIEKKLKEIHLKYFCGTENYSAASYLMLKIIHIMKLLNFHRIIIDTPLLKAVEFYKMFNFKNYEGSSKMFLHNENELIFSGGKLYKSKTIKTKQTRQIRNKKRKTNKNRKTNKKRKTRRLVL